MELKLAKRMSQLKASEIREILKVTERPEIISFAGGLPAPELFPVEEIKEVNRLVLKTEAGKALQYTTTEGYRPLREWIANRMNRKLGTSFDCDNILITHGSQQALDLSGKVFLDEGDVVICESPTYLAAISAFKAYGCSFIEISSDENGMNMAELEEKLGDCPKAKLIYMISDFQNPTGRTWGLERRKQLAEISARYGVAVIEDNPYGELRFEGDFLPSAKSFDSSGNILCTGTFSKIFCPGYRIGWIAGDKEIIRKYVLVKQGADLQCNTIAQMEIYQYLTLYDIETHIEKIRATYKNRRNVMIGAMEEFFPENVVFTRPQGGLFAWAELPPYLNSRELLTECLKQNVAFVPGGSFFPNGGKENTFRLNFSNMPEERIVIGINRLGSVIGRLIQSSI
ncbi:MAG TPA: PLP-dependent aminotransferase family protein [Oscillospiraceae bacterium]|nr:PLP-dependent aminotransferase family protein [Oscillospiraceae bacterium]HPK34719.1 PLP-dependent aminotransferase family protein [Oscillospiraceae bacterium]HPR76051.1 PLP-dependent aminotransferase family protein [Oscillospiraceae bacterium]